MRIIGAGLYMMYYFEPLQMFPLFTLVTLDKMQHVALLKRQRLSFSNSLLQAADVHQSYRSRARGQITKFCARLARLRPKPSETLLLPKELTKDWRLSSVQQTFTHVRCAPINGLVPNSDCFQQGGSNFAERLQPLPFNTLIA